MSEGFGWTLIQRANWIRGSSLSSKEKLLLYTLAGHDGPNGIYPSLATLEDELSMSRSNLFGPLKSLEAKGLLVRHKRTSDHNRASISTQYELRIPVGASPIADQGESNSRSAPDLIQTYPLICSGSAPDLYQITNSLREQSPGTVKENFGALPQTPPATPGHNGLTPPISRGSQTTLEGLGLPAQPASLPKPRKTPQKPAKQSNGEPEKEPSGYPEVVAAYFEAFSKARGDKPVFGSREGKAIRDLIAKAGQAKAIERIRAAYANEYWRAKVTIVEISANPDKYFGASKPVPRESNLPDVDDMIIAARRKNANPTK